MLTERIKEHKVNTFVFGVMAVKLLFIAIFSSDWQNQMFRPFVETFIANLGGSEWNPYQFYYLHDLPLSFPYMPLMLLLESIGGLSLEAVSSSNIFLQNFLFKVPVFFFDLLCFYYLKKMYGNRYKYIAVLYYASPITIYACFMHGQLDIIPMALLIGSLYYLLDKENDVVSAVFLAASILTKLHIIAVIPLVFLYICKKKSLKGAMFYMAVISAVSTVFILPFMSEGFVQLVFFAKEQSALFALNLDYDMFQIYVPILAVLFIYLVALNLKHISGELLMGFMGIVFTIFLILCQPMPGWFVWIIPFLTIFIATTDESHYIDIFVYGIFEVIYLILYIFLWKYQYVDLYIGDFSLYALKFNNESLKNIFFTILVAILLYYAFQMYKFNISNNVFFKRGNNSFVIGISGDSGSGKTELTNLIEKCLYRKNVLIYEGDGEHKWERGNAAWEEYTHLNPKANYLYKQAESIRQLKKGRSIIRRNYDHEIGRFTDYYKIYSKEFILVSGLHTLYLPQMRECLDLAIYMSTDENLRRGWKLRRDVVERGNDEEKVLAQIESRMEDAEKYIYPQKEKADLCICYSAAGGGKNLKELDVEFELGVGVDTEVYISVLSRHGICVEHEYAEDMKRQIIKIKGIKDAGNIPVYEIAGEIVPQMNEISRYSFSGMRAMDVIVCIMILMLISDKMLGGCYV